MLEEVQAYKLSYVLMVVNEFDLFEAIESSPKTAETIALEKGLNPLYLELILVFLKSFLFLRFENGKWYLSDKFKNKDYLTYLAQKDVIRYESHIAEQWITPLIIKETLSTINDVRPFEKIGWSESGINLYKKATYADNLKYISVIIHKYIKQLALYHIYPYGEGAEYIVEILQKRYNVSLNRKEQSKNSAILLYNKIHYINAIDFSKICNCVKDVDYIIVADFFLDGRNTFLNNLAIDWLTHGGINFLNKDNLYEVCSKNNFDVIESKFLEKINTDIIVLKYGGIVNEEDKSWCRRRWLDK